VARHRRGVARNKGAVTRDGEGVARNKEDVVRDSECVVEHGAGVGREKKGVELVGNCAATVEQPETAASGGLVVSRAPTLLASLK
jgi:hypothetical protein